MKEILRKFYKMNEKEKEELEGLYIFNELEKMLDILEDLHLSIAEEQIICEITRDCLKYTNSLSPKEILKRLLEILQCADITVYDIEDLGINELIELLSKNDRDFNFTEGKIEIASAFIYGRFYCVLMKNLDGYILIFEKDDGTQYMKEYENIEELLKYVIKNILKEKGDNVV